MLGALRAAVLCTAMGEALLAVRSQPVDSWPSGGGQVDHRAMQARVRIHVVCEARTKRFVSKHEVRYEDGGCVDAKVGNPKPDSNPTRTMMAQR